MYFDAGHLEALDGRPSPISSSLSSLTFMVLGFIMESYLLSIPHKQSKEQLITRDTSSIDIINEQKQ